MVSELADVYLLLCGSRHIVFGIVTPHTPFGESCESIFPFAEIALIIPPVRDNPELVSPISPQPECEIQMVSALE